MNIDPDILRVEERVALALRGLYRDRGYAPFRMGKFEEYDLYARNKEFLISENVLTFTDAGGRLMALKPDVTLSIVRAERDCAPAVRKLYYHENVYRPGPSGAFRELGQAGVECQGAIGEAQVGETLLLALESLRRISGAFRLELSHLGVLTGLLDRFGVAAGARREILGAVARKSPHEIARLCAEAAAAPEAAEALAILAALSGPPEAVLPALRDIGADAEALALLKRLGALAAREGFGEHLALNFSIVGHLNYYNGIVFRGFVRGAPGRVLSGGQYDGLMRKMGRRDRAVGFAVYLDALEYLEKTGEEAAE